MDSNDKIDMHIVMERLYLFVILREYTVEVLVCYLGTQNAFFVMNVH